MSERLKNGAVFMQLHTNVVRSGCCLPTGAASHA
jgi:hypothetical protein